MLSVRYADSATCVEAVVCGSYKKSKNQKIKKSLWIPTQNSIIEGSGDLGGEVRSNKNYSRSVS
jgi:hypothetical protein